MKNNPNQKKLSESLAKLEQDLFEAEQKGNTRKAKALKLIIKRLKKIRA